MFEELHRRADALLVLSSHVHPELRAAYRQEHKRLESALRLVQGSDSYKWGSRPVPDDEAVASAQRWVVEALRQRYSAAMPAHGVRYAPPGVIGRGAEQAAEWILWSIAAEVSDDAARERVAPALVRMLHRQEPGGPQHEATLVASLSRLVDMRHGLQPMAHPGPRKQILQQIQIVQESRFLSEADYLQEVNRSTHILGAMDVHLSTLQVDAVASVLPVNAPWGAFRRATAAAIAHRPGVHPRSPRMMSLAGEVAISRVAEDLAQRLDSRERVERLESAEVRASTWADTLQAHSRRLVSIPGAGRPIMPPVGPPSTPSLR